MNSSRGGAPSSSSSRLGVRRLDRRAGLPHARARASIACTAARKRRGQRRRGRRPRAARPRPAPAPRRGRRRSARRGRRARCRAAPCTPSPAVPATRPGLGQHVCGRDGCREVQGRHGGERISPEDTVQRGPAGPPELLAVLDHHAPQLRRAAVLHVPLGRRVPRRRGRDRPVADQPDVERRVDPRGAAVDALGVAQDQVQHGAVREREPEPVRPDQQLLPGAERAGRAERALEPQRRRHAAADQPVDLHRIGDLDPPHQRLGVVVGHLVRRHVGAHLQQARAEVTRARAREQHAQRDRGGRGGGQHDRRRAAGGGGGRAGPPRRRPAPSGRPRGRRSSGARGRSLVRARSARDTAARNAAGDHDGSRSRAQRGFIGGAVCRRLAADGDEPIGIDLAGADRRADVADPGQTVAALAGADAVVHAAAIVSERGRMADFVRVNTRGTRNVLDAAAGRPAVVIASVAGWGYEFRATAGRGRAAAALRDPVHRHQGRHRDAGAAPRRHGHPPRRRLRRRLAAVGRPAAGDDARGPLLPAGARRRPDHARLRGRPGRRDRARAARAARRRARLHGLGRRGGRPRASSSATTRGRSARTASGSSPRRCCASPPAPSAPARRRSRSCSAARPSRTRAPARSSAGSRACASRRAWHARWVIGPDAWRP